MHFCKHCEDGILEKVPSDEPWHPDYYVCTTCDSTYTVDQIEDEDEDFEQDTDLDFYVNVNPKNS